jgi:hypothetical protein
MELWIGCIAGALSDEEYTAKLLAAGFTDVRIEVTRIYDANDCGSLAKDPDTQTATREVGDKFVSAFVRAVKPRD